MKWFGKQPSIKWTKFYKLVGARKGVVIEWEHVHQSGEFTDEDTYHILKHKPTETLYRTCWGSLAPNGKLRPFGQYDPDRDYRSLQEVKAIQVTQYERIG